MPSTFSESDLHGLTDGHLEPAREAELVHRLKSFPLDRARVEAWREQNDLIKATFSEVESEAIPVSLSLSPPPRLRCVASGGLATIPRPGLNAISNTPASNPGSFVPGMSDPGRTAAPLFKTENLAPGLSGPDAATRRWSRARAITFSAVTGCLVILGFSTMRDRPAPKPNHSAPDPDRSATSLDRSTPGLALVVDASPSNRLDQGSARIGEGFGDNALAARTLEALARAPLTDKASFETGHPLSHDMPTLSIPDLADEGWRFTGATVQPSQPSALIFFYQNEDAERLALGVSDAPWSNQARPRRLGRTVMWRRRGKAYALGGSVDMRRLDAIALALQTDLDTMRATP